MGARRGSAGREAGLGRRGGARRILVNSTYRAIADIGGKLASLALYVVMARVVGDADFGVYAFALSFVSLVTILATLGQDFLLTREVSRDRSRLDELFANALALRVTLSVPVLLAAIAIASATGLAAQTRIVALLLGLGVVAELLATLCFAVFQAYERLGFIPVVLISQRWLTAIGGIAALLSGAGIELVAGIYSAFALAGFGFALVLVRRYVARPRLEIDVRRWWPLMRASSLIGVVTVFALILLRVDTAILAAFEPDAVVGQYAAAYRLLESTMFVSWSVSAAVIPVFSRLGPSTDPPVGVVLERALKLVAALTLPLAIVAALFAEPLVVGVYGEEYRPAATALLLLAPTVLLFSISYIASDLLIAQYRQRAVAITYGAVMLVNIGLNLLLIPWISLDGAALATSASELLVVGSTLLLATRITGAPDWRRMLAGTALAGAVAAAVMVTLRGSLVPALAVGAVVYVASLTVFERRTFPDDAAAIRALMSRAAPGASNPGD